MTGTATTTTATTSASSAEDARQLARKASREIRKQKGDTGGGGVVRTYYATKSKVRQSSFFHPADPRGIT